MTEKPSVTEEDRRQMEKMYLQGKSLSEIAGHVSLSLADCREQMYAIRETSWSDVGPFMLWLLEKYDDLESACAAAVPESIKKNKLSEKLVAKTIADRMSLIEVIQARRANPSLYRELDEADSAVRRGEMLTKRQTT